MRIVLIMVGMNELGKRLPAIGTYRTRPAPIVHGMWPNQLQYRGSGIIIIIRLRPAPLTFDPLTDKRLTRPMRRPSKDSTPKLSAESQRLVSLSQALMQAASRAEERAWERQLDTQLQKLL